MPALDFPNIGLYPGYQYSGPNGVVYTYDGTKWIGSSAIVNRTVNGVAYLNSDNVLTTNSALTFDGTTLTANTLTVTGNLSAGTITAALSGNAATSTALQTARTINGTSFDGTANINVTATATHALTFGTHLTGTSYNGSAAVTIATNATNLNTTSTIVARDASGNFSAGTITATLSGSATSATTATNLAGGTVSATSITDSGNLAFTGTGNRITGDFSNATVANRVAFQTSTTNGATEVATLPNGSSTTSRLNVLNSSDPNNTGRGTFLINATEVSLRSTVDGTGTNLPLTFQTANSERVRIDTSGKVGINVTPVAGTDAKLQLTGLATNATTLATAYSTAALVVVPKSTSGFSLAIASGTGDLPQLQVSANGAAAGDLLLQPYGGNVGIGTSSPAGKLHVNGGAFDSLTVSGNSTNSVGMRFQNTAASSKNYNIGSSGGGVGAAGSFFIYDDTAAAARLVIDTSGNVGIGTSSPGVKADINGVMRAASWSLSGTGVIGGTSAFTAGTVSTDTNWGMYFRAPTSSSAIAEYSFRNSADTERMRIDSSGNIGIGTRSPNQKLVVADTADNSSPLALCGGTSLVKDVGVSLLFQYNAPSGQVFSSIKGSWDATATGSSGNLAFFTRTAEVVTEKMRIDSSGNIGIGTTNPTVRLHVAGGQLLVGAAGGEGGEIQLQNVAGNAVSASIDVDSGNNLRIFNNGATYTSFATSNIERMRITSDGHLIPSTTNAYDLGSAANRWRNIYTQDLHLSNGIGDYTVVEGEEELYLVNNKTGKHFKFALIPVDPSEVPAKSEAH